MGIIRHFCLFIHIINICNIEKGQIFCPCIFQKLVSEVKALIKEVKKEGRDPEHIDLTSQDVAQKLQKRRSNLHVKNESSLPSEGLMSAMNQLAWERDLDLETKMGPLSEEKEPESAVKSKPPQPPTPKSNLFSKKAGKTSPETPSGNKNNNKTNDIKILNPQLLEMQMQDKHSASYGGRGRGGGGGKDGGEGKGGPANWLRSPRVSPEIIEDKPPKGGKKKPNNTTNNRTMTVPGSSRPPSARSSSGGSKDSKDSAFSEGVRRQITSLALSGSRSSLNSASSLTSLLHSSVGTDAKSKDTDDTDF